MRLFLSTLILIFLFSIQAAGSPGEDLLKAAQEGSAEAAQNLLQAGADVNAQDDEHGLSALMWAALNGHIEVAKILLNAGADVNAAGKKYTLTALMWAAARGHVKVVQALLNAGARVNTRSGDNSTALILAAYEGHIEAVRILLEAGADVHAQSDDGWTAPLFAKEMGHVDISYILNNTAIMLPEPLLFGGNVVIKDSKWKAGAESIIVRAVNIDFSRVEVDYTVSERESEYFKENKFKEDRIRRLKEYQTYQKLLWNVFANKPHESLFDPITTENWYAKWSYYREKLIEKAEQAGFSSKLLKKCIEKIEPGPNDKTALLPISAYYAKNGEDNVWIIICKWEYANNYKKDDGTTEFFLLGHIRGWAMIEKDQTELAFFTCGNYPFYCE